MSSVVTLRTLSLVKAGTLSRSRSLSPAAATAKRPPSGENLLGGCRWGQKGGIRRVEWAQRCATGRSSASRPAPPPPFLPHQEHRGMDKRRLSAIGFLFIRTAKIITSPPQICLYVACR